MSLEDDISDVVKKAMRGLGFTFPSLSQSSGVSPTILAAICNGEPENEALRTLAPHLHLRTEALLALKNYNPTAPFIPELHVLPLPFFHGNVNAYLIKTASFQILFDTGLSSNDLTETLIDSSISQVFITHAHPDHIGGISYCQENKIPIITESMALSKKEFHFGNLKIHAIDLSGHEVPAAGYLIEGLSKRVFITGDAIFAGSMGGCKTPENYQLALKTLKRALREESDDLVLLPGHGPLTTLGQERISNPFPIFS